jgi:radical SAM protein with 4Fe4S-binding SPASM domain
MAVFAAGRFLGERRLAEIESGQWGLVLEVFSDVFRPVITDPSMDGGVFYEIYADLPEGDYVVIPHLALPDHIGLGGTIAFTVLDVRGNPIIHEAMQINSLLFYEADNLFYKFGLSTRRNVILRLSSTKMASKIYLRYLTMHRVETLANMTRETFDTESSFTLPQKIKEVLVGSTSVCNAACVHCPTNKKLLSHLPSGVMEWDLYEKLILGLKEYGAPIGTICFGLFAEPLNDPILIDRLRFARENLPDVPLEIATNAAAFDRVRHNDIFSFLTRIAVHIEAVTPMVYNDLMRPLRADRDFPKIKEFILLAKEKTSVWITSPIHKKNLAEISKLRNLAAELGVSFSGGPLANRCTSSLVYDEIKLAPVASTCRQDITDGLVVDWDGSVLSCCIDFLKRTILGDLKVESVADVLQNSTRQKFYMMMKNGYWNRSESCRNCVADKYEVVEQIIAETEMPRLQT